MVDTGLGESAYGKDCRVEVDGYEPAEEGSGSAPSINRRVRAPSSEVTEPASGEIAERSRASSPDSPFNTQYWSGAMRMIE